MKKTIMLTVLIFFILINITLISASEPEESSYIFKRGDDIDLKISCIDTDNSLCAVQIPCYITIMLPNTTTIVEGDDMTYNSNYYSYALSGNNTQQLGNYATTVFCSGGTNGFSTFNFEVTPTGTTTTTAQGLIYFILIIVTMFLLIISMWGAWNIDGNNEFDHGGNLLRVNYNKHIKLLLFFVSYLFATFLTFLSWQVSRILLMDFMANIFRFLFIILEILLAPFFIALVVVLLIKWTADLKIQDLARRNLPKR